MKHELSPPELWLTLHGNVLYRYVLVRVRNVEIAEDLVQEAFLAALKAKETFAGKSSEQTWLIGILKHKMIDYFRASAREKTQEFHEQFRDEDNEYYFDQQGNWKIDQSYWSQPEQSMQQEQFIQVLEQCIDKLPKRMAQLFMLCELDNMKNEEACDLMSISTMNNFWVMQSRTRVQLRQCLDVNWINK